VGARANRRLIAHRRSALAAVNKLVVVSDGRQVAFGPREDVLSAVGPLQQQHRAPALRVAKGREIQDNVKVLAHAS